MKRLFLPLLLLLACSPLSAGDSWQVHLTVALKNGGAYAETEDGKVLFDHRSRDYFIPASTMKIATAACAIDRLGRDFRFATDFFITQDKRLIVKGYGDPFLVSEELAVAAAALASKGVKEVKGILLDTTYFEPDIKIDGTSNSTNPYDALNGALIANFNTVNVHKMGSGPRAAVYSAETQTPITPIAVESAEGLPPGQQRINIGQDPLKGARYVGELLSEFLKKEGVRVEGPIVPGAAPKNAQPVYRHLSSRRAEDVVRELLKFSTNFMANQVFLVLGAERFGPPANVEKAQTVLRDCLKNDAGWTNFHVHEGAGLSRKNAVTPRQMVDLLRHFEPHLDLLPREEGVFRAKTGTLTGVNTLAGFFPMSDGKMARFAILVNSPVPFDYKFKLAKMLYDGVNASP
ncbi:MAG TPA: D-alanyl-D-alanine carboxypeptidase [bacterium]|nr:D-alanyl-D-alanine carboxypeptidase [bacterium]